MSQDEAYESHGCQLPDAQVNDLIRIQEKQSVSFSTKTANEISLNNLSTEEEWTIEDSEQLQEHDEYYEDEASCGGENDAQKDNSDQYFNSMDQHNDSPVIDDYQIIGFNEGVEVRMVNDEFKSNSINGVTAIVSSQDSDEVSNTVNHSKEVCVTYQNSIFYDIAATSTTEIKACETSCLSSSSHDIVGASSNCSLYLKPQPISPFQTTASIEPPVMNQQDVPVKLQFGLFTGPSLIPSPVQVTQIGSIQMPLHPRTRILSPGHKNQQQPGFQFGQVGYSSSIPQMSFQSIPYTHSNTSQRKH